MLDYTEILIRYSQQILRDDYNLAEIFFKKATVKYGYNDFFLVYVRVSA